MAANENAAPQNDPMMFKIPKGAWKRGDDYTVDVGNNKKLRIISRHVYVCVGDRSRNMWAAENLATEVDLVPIINNVAQATIRAHDAIDCTGDTSGIIAMLRCGGMQRALVRALRQYGDNYYPDRANREALTTLKRERRAVWCAIVPVKAQLIASSVFRHEKKMARPAKTVNVQEVPAQTAAPQQQPRETSERRMPREQPVGARTGGASNGRLERRPDLGNILADVLYEAATPLIITEMIRRARVRGYKSNWQQPANEFSRVLTTDGRFMSPGYRGPAKLYNLTPATYSSMLRTRQQQPEQEASTPQPANT